MIDAGINAERTHDRSAHLFLADRRADAIRRAQILLDRRADAALNTSASGIAIERDVDRHRHRCGEHAALPHWRDATALAGRRAEHPIAHFAQHVAGWHAIGIINALHERIEREE